MNLAAAIRERNAAELPSKRDEDWRWTDLRGLIRTAPEPSQPFTGQLPPGPFDALAEDWRVLINGGEATVDVPARTEAVEALRFVARGAGSHVASATIRVGANARLLLLESYESDGASLALASLTLALEPGAVVERIVLTADHEDAVSVSQAEVTLSPTAGFSQTLVAGGARRQRLETRVLHPGGSAELRLDGIYLLAGKRHSDQTSIVTHAGTDGLTVQLAKGVVRDQARGVFQGRIVVEEGADRTDARMGHHALILSDRAEVDAKPELEIYADDVACAHGNTVGALDEDALFYARQRGIPEDEARALLTEAFVGEVVDRIGHEGAREIVRAWVAQGLRD
ncbi:Fe-S cluster assembly protein SufD [Phenylobacterium sp.]|uniref:Fe-S cluster assembly protein SufD n=1 Tax=Phenylobacterium sp. TaxID=1871053 RepID=UPI001201DAB6|nr:Fe-S cluster assembly protein SufD [Phenylobacterium sp.]THD59683.1 MAG: Fe-S cluster assembly protein SufD [Phenylobacterium sp.]